MINKMPQKHKDPLPNIPELKHPIGERIARIRKQKGLTQVEVAERIGISQPLYSSYERGRLGVSGEMVVRIALALDVSTDEILGLEPTKRETLPPKLTKRLAKIKDLPPHQQKILLQNIDMFLKGASSHAS